MIRGLYISGTLMKANEKILETIGNNIANIETTGFKRDEVGQESFNDILISKYNGSDLSLQEVFDGVTVKNDRPGFFEVETKGGYFVAKTDDGLNYSKSLRFAKDKDGYLSTYYLNSDRQQDYNLGSRIVGQKGEIFIGDQEFEVDEQGNVTVGGQVIDNLVKMVSRDVIGSMGSGVRADRIVTDFSQGNLIPTGNMLDIALKGEGFMEVKTPYGTMFTRNGAMTLDKDQKLVTSEGYPIQGFNGDIVLGEGMISINELGEVLMDGTIVDKLKLVNFTNKGDLNKVGLGLMKVKENMTGQMTAFDGKVIQGSVEQSNVNAIAEMIRMISVQRDYENGQKLIRTIDETIQKAVTEVGTFR